MKIDPETDRIYRVPCASCTRYITQYEKPTEDKVYLCTVCAKGEGDE